MSQSPWRALRAAAWLILALVFLLLFVLPLMTSLMIQVMDEPPPVLSSYLGWIEIAQRWLMRLTACLFFFAIGSCFASFLNVVAWRIPRGRSILGPSRCPYCHTQLSFRDNFPIVGWLRNNGRCRTCRLPIRVRYLVVEIILGTVFLGVGMLTLATGGATLPVRIPNELAGFERVLFQPQWDLIQIISGQLVLILFLFTFALIESDQDPLQIPVSLFMTGLLTGIAMAFIWPAMLLIVYDWPVNQIWPIPRFSSEQFISLATGVILGSAIGFAIHWLEIRITNRKNRKLQNEAETANQSADLLPESKHPCNAWFGTGLIGLFLGWQSAVIVAAWYLVLKISWSSAGPQVEAQPTTNRMMFCCCLLHLATWRWLNVLA